MGSTGEERERRRNSLLLQTEPHLDYYTVVCLLLGICIAQINVEQDKKTSAVLSSISQFDLLEIDRNNVLKSYFLALRRADSFQGSGKGRGKFRSDGGERGLSPSPSLWVGVPLRPRTSVQICHHNVVTCPFGDFSSALFFWKSGVTISSALMRKLDKNPLSRTSLAEG